MTWIDNLILAFAFFGLWRHACRLDKLEQKEDIDA